MFARKRLLGRRGRIFCAFLTERSRIIYDYSMPRPKEFDPEAVISRITLLFWEKGFAGTSLDDIMRATRLKKGSLYSSFGNKEKLFTLALKHYAAGGPAQPKAGSGAIDTLVMLYEKLIGGAASPAGRRRGCLIFNSGLEFGAKRSRLTAPVMSEVKRLEGFFRDLLLAAHKAGEIPGNIDPGKAAERAFAAAFTIREISKFKSEPDFLRDIANQALASIGAGKRV